MSDQNSDQPKDSEGSVTLHLSGKKTTERESFKPKSPKISSHSHGDHDHSHGGGHGHSHGGGHGHSHGGGHGHSHGGDENSPKREKKRKSPRSSKLEPSAPASSSSSEAIPAVRSNSMDESNDRKSTASLEQEGERCTEKDSCLWQDRESKLCSKAADPDSHTHHDQCGHTRVQHNGHYDYLVDDDLHFVHNGHCDYHGSLRSKIAAGSDCDTASLLFKPKRRNLLAAYLQANPNEEDIYHPPVKRGLRNESVWRFLAMLLLTGSYFFVELIVGYAIGSLALVADAFHMLSDLLALFVGFYAQRQALREKSSSATYGYVRMEVIGGLVNAVFLLSLCLTLILSSIERFYMGPSDELKKSGQILIIVASVGLGINAIGMCIFGSHGGHGHSHGGGHGHSHGGGDHGHSHGSEKKKSSKKRDHDEHGHDEHDHDHQNDTKEEIDTDSQSKNKSSKAEKNINIHGVFLHLLGDALGSIGVIVAGVVIAYADSSHRFLADPIMTLVISLLLISSTLPLLKLTIRILLQIVPNSIDVESLQKELKSIRGVVEIHDFHIWQLSADRVVCSFHVMLEKDVDFPQIADQLKLLLHKYSIHTSTIQPEYISTSWNKETRASDYCNEPICIDQGCQRKVCCPPTKSPWISERKIVVLLQDQ